MTEPMVQIALDTTDIAIALDLGDQALRAGADWLEIGKPLVEFHGLKGLHPIAEAFPGAPLLLDLMIMSSPQRYVEAACALGVAAVTVTALAPEHTVLAAIEAGSAAGLVVVVDLFNVPNVVAQAIRYAAAGASVMVHFGVDQKRAQPSGSPVELLREVAAAVSTPVSYATYDAQESRAAVSAGADIIVQGEPLLSAEHPYEEFRRFIRATKSHTEGGIK